MEKDVVLTKIADLNNLETLAAINWFFDEISDGYKIDQKSYQEINLELIDEDEFVKAIKGLLKNLLEYPISDEIKKIVGNVVEEASDSFRSSEEVSVSAEVLGKSFTWLQGFRKILNAIVIRFEYSCNDKKIFNNGDYVHEVEKRIAFKFNIGLNN